MSGQFVFKASVTDLTSQLYNNDFTRIVIMNIYNIP